MTHLDTAEIYGPYTNEALVGRAIKGRRDRVVLATKFGIVSHSGGGPGVLDSSPSNIRVAVDGSLKRLGTDHIDLYDRHRVDPNTPIEDTVGALADLVAEGRSATSACPRLAPLRSAAPTRCIRLRRFRPSTPCGRVIRKPTCCRYCASWASDSFPTRRSTFRKSLQKCRLANARPEPDFRYGSNRAAWDSSGNSSDTITDHGRWFLV